MYLMKGSQQSSRASKKRKREGEKREKEGELGDVFLDVRYSF